MLSKGDASSSLLARIKLFFYRNIYRFFLKHLLKFITGKSDLERIVSFIHSLLLSLLSFVILGVLNTFLLIGKI